MKWFATVSRLLVGVGLAALASAAPQLTGSAVGQWEQLSSHKSIVLAEAPSDQGEAIYDLRMHVLGDGSGRVRGEMRQRPQEGEGGASIIDLRYSLEGIHVTLPDGRIGVRAKILLDLSQFGGEGLIEVGRMEGLMFPVIGALGYCPVLPARNGDARVGAKDATSVGTQIQIIEPVGAPEPELGVFIARWILD